MATILKITTHLRAAPGDYLFIDKNTVKAIRGPAFDTLLGIAADHTPPHKETRNGAEGRNGWKKTPPSDIEKRRTAVYDVLKTLHPRSLSPAEVTGLMHPDLEVGTREYAQARSATSHDLEKLFELGEVNRVDIGNGIFRSRHKYFTEN